LKGINGGPEPFSGGGGPDVWGRWDEIKEGGGVNKEKKASNQTPKQEKKKRQEHTSTLPD